MVMPPWPAAGPERPKRFDVGCDMEVIDEVSPEARASVRRT
jgi:hypothetical protein